MTRRTVLLLLIFLLLVTFKLLAQPPSLTVREQDGTPTEHGVFEIRFSNGSVTKVSDGIVLIDVTVAAEADSIMLLEIGDNVLLETGDNVLLETIV